MTDPALEGWKSHTQPGFFGLVGPLWTRKHGDSWAYGFLAEERHTNRAGIVQGSLTVEKPVRSPPPPPF